MKFWKAIATAVTKDHLTPLPLTSTPIFRA